LSLRNLSASVVRFSGPKLSSPVRVESVFHRDALVQLSLDAAVRSIGFVSKAVFEGVPVELKATTIDRDGKRYYLDIVEDREARDLRSEGLAVRALDDLGLQALEKTAADILAAPVHANCETIWKHARDRVATADQFDVFHVLADDGPQPLGRLAAAARVSEEAILSMACGDLVEIGIYDGPLCSGSMIRRRDRVRLSPPQVITAAF
jgi:hypothetical protein